MVLATDAFGAARRRLPTSPMSPRTGGTFAGGNDNDIIDGGAGNNQLSGGAGNDVLRVRDATTYSTATLAMTA
jgi:Ca2+-binding RTX toxin-like protein